MQLNVKRPLFKKQIFCANGNFNYEAKNWQNRKLGCAYVTIGLKSIAFIQALQQAHVDKERSKTEQNKIETILSRKVFGHLPQPFKARQTSMADVLRTHVLH